MSTSRKSISIRGTTYARIQDFLLSPSNNTGITSISGFIENLIEERLSGTLAGKSWQPSLESSLKTAVEEIPGLTFVSFHRCGPFGGNLAVQLQAEGTVQSYHLLKESVDGVSAMERDSALKEKLLASLNDLIRKNSLEDETSISIPVWEEDDEEISVSEEGEEIEENCSKVDEVQKSNVVSEPTPEHNQEDEEGAPSFVDKENSYVPPVLLL